MFRFAGLLLAMAFTTQAQAQTLSRDLQALGLGSAEWRAMGEAEQQLYSPEVAASGATSEWTTPEGSAGTVTMLESTVGADGKKCVLMNHAFTTARFATLREVRLRRCQEASGRWILG